MTNEGDKPKRKYHLEERTAKFGEAVIRFAKRVPVNPVNTPLITQLVKAGTSMGANYCEADDAESKNDFLHKIGVCRKEARETKYWLRMMAAAEPGMKDDLRLLWQEAKELHLIFVAIVRKGRSDN
jgi:four helix bundle protein